MDCLHHKEKTVILSKRLLERLHPTLRFLEDSLAIIDRNDWMSRILHMAALLTFLVKVEKISTT